MQQIRGMKSLFCFLITVVLLNHSSFAQQRSIQNLVGKWEAVDSENSSGGIEVVSGDQIFLVYGSEKKPVHSFRLDFSKSPAWFDFTVKDSASTITLKSLIQFINEDLIQWQLFDGDVRPAHFTNSGGQMVYLRRKK